MLGYVLISNKLEYSYENDKNCNNTIYGVYFIVLFL